MTKDGRAGSGDQQNPQAELYGKLQEVGDPIADPHWRSAPWSKRITCALENKSSTQHSRDPESGKRKLTRNSGKAKENVKDFSQNLGKRRKFAREHETE